MRSKQLTRLVRAFLWALDMAKILLNYNPTTQVSTYWHEGMDSGLAGVIETQQTGLEHIADYCKEAREANKFSGYGDGGMDYKIPAAMAGQLMREGHLFDPVYMARWKKDHPEYSLRGGQKYFKGGM